MQSRRWWQAAILTTLIGAVGYVQGVSAKSTFVPATASAAETAQFAQDHARRLQAAVEANNTPEAVNLRNEVLAPLDPAKKPPYPFNPLDYSTALVKAFEGLLDANAHAGADAAKNSTANNLAFNGALVICNPVLDAFATDRALGHALKNSNPAVRYWAAKGLSVSLPVLAAQFPAGIFGPKGLLPIIQAELAAETSGLVVAELHDGLAHAAVAARNGGAAKLIDVLAGSMVKQAAAWQNTRPTPEDLGAAAATLDAVAEMENAANKVPLTSTQQGQILTAICAYMSYAVQWDQHDHPDATIGSAVYRVIEAGRTALRNINGFVVPSIKTAEPTGTAKLTINGAVGSSADFKNFPGATQPGDTPENADK